jgi:hypothetical protein
VTPSSMRMQLKFRDGTSEHERAVVLAQITASTARAEPLFPGESDPELASIYTVEDVPETGAEALTRSVGAHDAVEFIEPSAERKQIR